MEAFNTCVVGVGNFLLSLLKPTAAITSAVNVLRARVAVTALRSVKSAPRSVLVADARVPDLSGIAARESVRLLLQLECSIFRDTALAPRVVAVLLAQHHRGSGRLRSWVHVTLDAIASRAARLGVPSPRGVAQNGGIAVAPMAARNAVSQPSHTAAHAAGVYGRAVGFVTWQIAARGSAGLPRRLAAPPDGGPIAAVASVTDPASIPTAPPCAHAAGLHFNYCARSTRRWTRNRSTRRCRRWGLAPRAACCRW